MGIKELAFIKKAQAEYMKLFGSKLEIDFVTMKGITSNVTTSRRSEVMSIGELNDILARNNVTLAEVLEDKKTWKKGAILNFMNDFCSVVQLNPTLCFKRNGALINRDRTIIYYYTNIERSRFNKSKLIKDRHSKKIRLTELKVAADRQIKFEKWKAENE